MLFRAAVPQRVRHRVVGLGSRVGRVARERLEAAGIDDLQSSTEAARRRLERARFGDDVAYAEHLIARAIRQGRREADHQGPAR